MRFYASVAKGGVDLVQVNRTSGCRLGRAQQHQDPHSADHVVMPHPNQVSMAHTSPAEALFLTGDLPCVFLAFNGSCDAGRFRYTDHALHHEISQHPVATELHCLIRQLLVRFMHV